MERVAVLGVGVIGGSVALKLSATGVEVTVFDADPAALAAASDGGLATAETLPDALVGADLAVVAVPLDQSYEVFDRIAPSRVTAITDVGSAKGAVVGRATEILGPRFVGGHPMAGSERHGFSAASPDLFEDAAWILTPTEETDQEAYRTVTDLVGLLGARPVALTPAAHDALLARLSHLPQLVASAVVHVASGGGEDEALLGLAAGGFRDVTRIAASNPDMWVPIIRANREGVLEALKGLSAELEGLSGLVADERWAELGGFLASAREARLARFARPDHSAEPVTLSLLVPDRPGVLAEVTTAAGNLGANIEDLKIFHSTEGGRGRLELVVTGGGPARALTHKLEALGYHVDEGIPE